MYIHHIQAPIIKKLSKFILLFSTLFAFSATGALADQSIPYLKSLIGSGTLKYTDTQKVQRTLKARVIKHSNVQIGSHRGCTGFTLKTTIDKIVTLLNCRSSKNYLCPKGIKNCENPNIGKVKARKSTWTAYSNIGKLRYKVEFQPGRIIYRIQGKKCAIHYPHGCLVSRLSWNDQYVYYFSSNTK